MSIAARSSVTAGLLILLAWAWGPAARTASVLQVPPDDDEAAYREAMVRRSLQDNCLICHTEDMIAGQRLTPAQWKAEVNKMVNWGSPLPKEETVPLVEYLTRKFPDKEAPPAPARASLAAVGSLELPTDQGSPLPSTGDPARGERLYAANCAICHGPAALGGDLGPSLVNKAILDHPKEYDQILKEGLRRMPGFQLTMKAKDQADVLSWLRRRPYPEPSR